MAITKVPGYNTGNLPVYGTQDFGVGQPKPRTLYNPPAPLTGALGAGQSAITGFLGTPAVSQAIGVGNNYAPSGAAGIGAGAGAGTLGAGGAAGASQVAPPTLDVAPYMRELTSDPMYQSGLTSYQNSLQANQNMLQAAARQAVIQGGWGMTGNLSNIGGQNLSGLIDQGTLDAASANQMSDKAQLGIQLSRGLADVPSQLAARGAARSGAANIAAANLQNQYDVAANASLQNLASALGGDVTSWAQNNANALGNWNYLQGNIADRLANIATANAQAAYNSQMAAYQAAQNQPKTVNLGPTTITQAPTGPSPATVNAINKVKAAIGNAAMLKANPRVYQTMRNAI